MSEAVNSHLGISSKELERRQYEVAMIAEMYHTSSLYHDDVIDKAELRRNRDSVNVKWGQKSSVMAGNYAIATSNILLGQLQDPDVSGIFCVYIVLMHLANDQGLKEVHKSKKKILDFKWPLK